MNDEEKKAIKIVKEIKNIKFKVTSSFYSSGTVSLTIEEKEAIDTILNLITKLQKEIEHQKEKRENQKGELAILNEKQKEMNKLINDVKSYKGQFKRQEKEIKKLQKENETIIKLNANMSKRHLNDIFKIKNYEKQIDLMSEYMEENMDEYQLDEIYAKQYNCNGMERNWTRGKEKEVKEIKQYFAKLAKEKGE